MKDHCVIRNLGRVGCVRDWILLCIVQLSDQSREKTEVFKQLHLQ